MSVPGKDQGRDACPSCNGLGMVEPIGDPCGTCNGSNFSPVAGKDRQEERCPTCDSGTKGYRRWLWCRDEWHEGDGLRSATAGVTKVSGVVPNNETDEDSQMASPCFCKSGTWPEAGGTVESIMLTPPEWAGQEKPIAVDACIADQVRRLWDAGIWTLSSCCGHNCRPGMRGVVVHREDAERARRELTDDSIKVFAWVLTEYEDAIPPEFAAIVDALSKEFAGEFPKRWAEAFERGQREGGLIPTQPEPNGEGPKPEPSVPVTDLGEEGRVEAAAKALWDQQFYPKHGEWPPPRQSFDPDEGMGLADYVRADASRILEAADFAASSIAKRYETRGPSVSADLVAVDRKALKTLLDGFYQNRAIPESVYQQLRAALLEGSEEG